MDACLVIIAGSDTTSSVLSSMIYCLLTHPEYGTRLREELSSALPVELENWPSDCATVLAGLPLLNAIM